MRHEVCYNRYQMIGVRRVIASRGGLSFIEVLVAMAILATVSTVLMGSVPVIFRALQNSSERAVAADLAGGLMAQISTNPKLDLPVTVVEVDDVEYTLSTSRGVVAGYNPETLRAVTVKVEWKSATGGRKVHLATTCLVGNWKDVVE